MFVSSQNFVLYCLTVLLLIAGVVGLRRDTTLKRLKDSCFTNSSNCCFALGEEPWVQHTPRCVFDPINQSYPCAIKLGVNNWDSSFLNVYVARIFLEEFLGYPVEIRADYDAFKAVSEEEGGIVPLADMWTSLVSSQVDAILEAWEIEMESDRQKFIVEEETVVDAGPLGVIGSLGWFMPTYFIKDNSYANANIYECNDAQFFEYWLSLESPQAAELFKDPSASRPCCPTDSYAASGFPCLASEAQGGTPVEHGGFNTSEDCNLAAQYPTFAGRFLDGAADWTQYDDQIIRNLGLNFTVEYAGSEAEIINQAIQSVQTQVPLLFYFWEPHALFKFLNLSRVLLPRHSRECWDKRKSGGVDCDYPAEVLFKVYRRGFEAELPDAAKFLEVMQFADNRDQEVILLDVVFDGQDFPTAACKWAKDPKNRNTWSRWVSSVAKIFNNTAEINAPPVNTSLVCGCSSGIRNVVQVLSLAEISPVATIAEDPDPCALNGASVYTARWISIHQQTMVISHVQCFYASLDTVSAIAAVAVSSTVLVVLLVMLVLLIIYKRNAFIKASSFATLATFLVGCMSMNLFPLLSIGPPTPLLCGLRVASLVYGYAWFQGSLLVKLYVLYKIFTPFRRVSPISAKQLQVQPLYNFAFASVVLLIWGLVVTFEPIAVYEDELAGMQQVEPAQTCPSNVVFIGVLILSVAAFTMLSAYMSYQTRFISGAFSEARFTALTSYNLILFGAFAYIITQAGAIDVSASEQMLYISIGIVWVTVFSAILIVGTRLYAAISGLHFDTQELLVKSSKDSRFAAGKVIVSSGRNGRFVYGLRSAKNSSVVSGRSHIQSASESSSHTKTRIEGVSQENQDS